MKTAILTLAVLLAPTAAFAQTAPAAAPAAEAAAAEGLSTHTPIEKLMADPVGREAVLKQYPDILENPLYEQLKGNSLRQLAEMAPAIFSEEILGKIDSDLRAAK